MMISKGLVTIYTAPFQWDAKDFTASEVAAGFIPLCRTSLKYREYWSVRYSADL